MITGTVDSGTAQAALELAGRAPSVHNTPPWRWQLGDGAVHLYADTERWLPATDPDARDLIMSCGAWLHHLRMALAASDIGVTVDRFPDPDELDLLAVVTLRPGADAIDRALASEQVAAIGVRREVEHAEAFGYEAELATWTGFADGTGPDRAGVPAATIPGHDPRVGSPMRRFAGGGVAGATEPDNAADAATVLVEVLGGTLSPQLVLRVGWPPAKGPVPPPTARLSSVGEVEGRR
jgi:hypothetical protein